MVIFDAVLLRCSGTFLLGIRLSLSVNINMWPLFLLARATGLWLAHAVVIFESAPLDTINNVSVLCLIHLQFRRWHFDLWNSCFTLLCKLTYQSAHYQTSIIGDTYCWVEFRLYTSSYILVVHQTCFCVFFQININTDVRLVQVNERLWKYRLLVGLDDSESLCMGTLQESLKNIKSEKDPFVQGDVVVGHTCIVSLNWFLFCMYVQFFLGNTGFLWQCKNIHLGIVNLNIDHSVLPALDWHPN